MIGVEDSREETTRARTNRYDGGIPVSSRKAPLCPEIQLHRSHPYFETLADRIGRVKPFQDPDGEDGEYMEYQM
jgi:hypothetical protein